jgi:TonB family protein
MRSQKRHGDKITCFEFENDKKQPSEICLNDDSGLVARDTPYGDSDFRPVADKIFPRFLSYEWDHKVVAKVNVIELITPIQIGANSFIPPSGVSSQPGCMNPTPTRIVKKVIPQYPQGARQNHIEGTVGVDVVIGVDGVPRNIQAVASSSPDLARASMKAIKDCRYEPASCAGTAVAVETVLSVNYSLH